MNIGKKWAFFAFLYAFIFLQVIFNLNASNSEAFMITISDLNYFVSSPRIFNEQVSVIIENKTMNDIYGKVSIGDNFLEYITIEDGNSKSIEFKLKKNDKIIFTPLAPAFQEIVLEFGNETYEIPSAKQTE